MATTITATVQAGNPQRVLVVVNGLGGSPAATACTVYRVVDGNRTPLRPSPLTASQLTAGTAVLVDLEAPFGEAVTYVAAVTRSGVILDEATSTPAVTITATRPWITDPVTGQGFTTTVVTWPEWSVQGRTATVPVVGAWYPIVESGAMIAPTSTLTLYTATESDLRALRASLNPGKVLLLRPVCDGVETAYLAIGRRVESRRGDPGKGWARLHDLEVQEVGVPAVGIASTGDTLNDLQRVVPTTLQAIATRWPGALLDIATTNLAVL
jgi:hypothetical protein